MIWFDYQLCYKKNIEEKTSQQIQKKLAKYADEMAGMDRQKKEGNNGL